VRVALALIALTSAARAEGLALVGINLPGAEFGIARMEDAHSSLGSYGKDYIYPSHAEFDDYAALGFNVARVPFLWERMQPNPNGPLDQAQLGYMDDVVQYGAKKGFRILLDPHNYGYGYGHMIGTPGTPNSVFADFWHRMATHYAHSPNVMFGLMNEPYSQTPVQWLASANAAIAAIRAAGAPQEILVPGTYHENGWSYVRQGNAREFAERVVDPGHNLAFEIHQYLDSDQSGGSTVPVSPTIGAERLAEVTAWAEATHSRLFLGEFGAGPDPTSLQAMRNQLSFMAAHSAVWQGATAWAGGPWWPKGNPWSIDSVDGVATPQARTLQSFVRKP
jgi:endoglucanase